MPFISKINGVNFAASQAETAITADTSSYLNPLNQDLTISGSVTILTNLNVFGSQSVAYLTSSQLDISTNLITVNTSTPAIRFGGIAVRDSGSLATGLTGSLLWDSQNDVWLYSNPSGAAYDGGLLLTGPRNTTGLGNEVGINSGYAAVGNGSHHMTSSAIYSSGSLIRLENNTQVTGSLNVSSGITGSLFGTASWATNFVSASNYVLNNQTSSITVGTASKVAGGTTNYISLWSDSTTLGSSVFYQNNNNIGLGTISPNTTLHISASSAQPLLNIENATPTGYTNMRFTGTGRKYIIGVGNDSETLFGIANDFFLYDDNSGNIRMVVDPNGNVGIGTTSPSSLLQVNGTVTANSFIGDLTGTAATASILSSDFAPSFITYSGGNQSNSTTTLADVHSSAGWSNISTGFYEFEIYINYNAGATTTGTKFSLSGSVTFSYLACDVGYNTATTDRAASMFRVFDGGSTAVSSQFLTSNASILQGHINITSTGQLRLRFASEIASSAITVTDVFGYLRRLY